MPKQDDTARQATRLLLANIQEALGQPPLHAVVAQALMAMIRLLGEQDLDKRLAAREHISAYLAETWGESR
jgi:hypothetical protein